MRNKNLFVCAVAALSLLPVSSALAKTGGLFDVEARRKELQTSQYAAVREACLADDVNEPDKEIPAPVAGLKETEGYGTDGSAGDFSWFVMVHGSRALAGEKKSEDLLKRALLQWADAGALSQTQEVHDAYYALKRSLLSTIVSYTIVRESFSADERKKIEGWIDPLVRMVDKKFDGDVDHNNHRYLADSVLTLWGSVIGDRQLYAKGRERFEIALDQMLPDGALPLETRRGARALWYTRQAIADLTLIAEVYDHNGDDLYGMKREGKSLPLLVNSFVSAVRAPVMILPDASANVIPGHSADFMNQDMAFLERRGGRRNYMAFSHAYIRHYGKDEFSSARLKALMQETGFRELPLIDEYIGGNATCFWGQP